MEIIDKEEYRNKIISLMNLKSVNRNIEIDKVLDKLIREVTLLTFEKNMNIFPITGSTIRRT